MCFLTHPHHRLSAFLTGARPPSNLSWTSLAGIEPVTCLGGLLPETGFEPLALLSASSPKVVSMKEEEGANLSF